MVSMNELKQDMIIGMGYIGLDSGRLYRMRRGPKLIDAVASGSTIIINDAAEGRPFRGFRVFGKSTQDGTPSVEKPIPIVSVGEGGSIKVDVTGQNLLKPDNRNVFCALHLRANTAITLMTNGRPSEGGNIKFVGADGSDTWFSIDKGQTRVCRPIKNDVKGFYELLEPSAGLNYMLAVGDVQDYKPYIDPQPLTLQTPNGLPGVPVSKDGNYTDADGQQWICDEIDLGRGKYVQRVKKINVKSLSGYNLSENFGSIKVEGILSTQSRVPVMSNRFAFGTSIKDDGTCFAYGDVIRLYYNLGSLENFNKWLTDNDVVVWYPLETPVERDLTPEEIAAYKALRTYGPTTVVSNDAGAGMEVTYVADTKTYIDNKIAALNKAVLDAVGGI